MFVFCRVVSAEAYELNTSDDCPPDKLAANMPEAALSNELKSRLMSAYELRRDIMAGRMVRLLLVFCSSCRGIPIYCGSA